MWRRAPTTTKMAGKGMRGLRYLVRVRVRVKVRVRVRLRVRVRPILTLTLTLTLSLSLTEPLGGVGGGEAEDERLDLVGERVEELLGELYLVLEDLIEEHVLRLGGEGRRTRE